MRNSEFRAYVLVYADADIRTSITHLVIHNVGRTHATDVRIDFDPTLEGPDEGLADLAIWKGIPVLPPGRSESVFWGMGFELAGEGSTYNLTYDVRVSYNSPAVQKSRIIERSVVDLSVFKDVHRVTPRPLQRIEEPLSKIQETLSRIERAIKD